MRRVSEMVNARGGQVVRRLRRAPHQPQPLAAAPVRPPAPAVTGLVEQFSKALVVGWISVPRNAPPTQVTLHLGGVQISATYATASNTMSGVTSVLRKGRTGAGPAVAPIPPSADPVVHNWQRPNVAGPVGDRRNSRQQIRTFSFRVRGVWDFASPRTKITVRVDGRPLPIFGHGMFLTPPKRGKQSLAELKQLLGQGHLFSQYGRLQLSKRLDTEWQQRVMGLYQRTRELIAEHYGYDLFFIYGTLLGAVREGTYIGHDIDFDAAYVSRHSNGADATAELVELALMLVDNGLQVEPMFTTLHIFDPDDRDARIDVFHTFFDDAGVWRFPFGIAGKGVVSKDDWQGTQEIDFPGGKGLVPVNAEQLVEHLYGADWRRPKPGFNWNLDRTDKAVEGEMVEEQRSKVYWANFYAHMSYSEGSTFFEFVNARPETPDWVLDIGCGDGRDACAFGSAGRHVLGLDQSPVGVHNARRRTEDLGLTDRVAFEVCDVADSARVGQLVSARQEQAQGPVLFYLRFFLHSLTEEVQDALLDELAKLARDGDLFAAEFRTDKDAEMDKVHGKHFRRFQNAEDFAARLTGERGFSILHQEESTGLSPYRGEDPVLYRVLARR